MELKDIVVSYELSKKIKELGVVKESIFGYCRYIDNELCMIKVIPDSQIVGYTTIDQRYYTEGDIDDVVMAYTSDELLELLPWVVYPHKDSPEADFHAEIRKTGETGDEVLYHVEFWNQDHDIDWLSTCSKSLPNALADMLIHLLENNLIDIKDLK